MIRGHFSEIGELLFDIELISANNERISAEALLDTGFTEWLAINVQDAESLGWTLLETERDLQTARGQEFFDLYIGTIVIDNLEFTVPVYAGEGIGEILLGLQWLQSRRLIVDYPQGFLTLGSD